MSAPVPESLPEEMTPALAAVGLLQLALLLIGLRVLWVVVFSPAARARAGGAQPLAPWLLPGPDFLAAALLVLSGGFGLQMIVVLLFRAPWLMPLRADEELMLVVQGAAFQLGLLCGAGVAVAFTRTRVAPPDASGPPPPVRIVRAGAAAFVAALPVVTAFNLVWMTLLRTSGVEAAPQELVFLMVEAESPLTSALLVLFAVIVAPVTEEVVFRAGLFRYLRTRVPRWAAYLLPAVVFAALHGNLAAFVPLTVLGIAFAIAYERTGRLIVPIIAHGLFNLNTIVLLLGGVAL